LKLHKILVAARQKKSYFGVWIGNAHVLTDVWLNLSTQSITINNFSTLTVSYHFTWFFFAWLTFMFDLSDYVPFHWL